LSSYPDIELEIDAKTLEPITDDVQAFEIFREGLGRDFYGSVLNTLEDVGGYTRRRIGDYGDPTGRTYYVYLYDWRLDNVTAVQGLHELIERVAEEQGNPAQQVDVLAHSNGGLLARYYARYGTADVLSEPPEHASGNGSRRIRRLLLVGTPNLGSMQPVLSHVRGEEMGLRHIPADVVATCSGAPQLMPHPDHRWLVDLRGDPVDLDLYDIETWRELRWSIFSSASRGRMIRRRGSRKAADAHKEVLEAYLARHLVRGRRFQEALSQPAGPDEPRPYLFGGDCAPTVARLVLGRNRNVYSGYERAGNIPNPLRGMDYESLINDPGDGVVTRESLMGRPSRRAEMQVAPLEISHSVFLCEAHQSLTGNLSFQDNLLYTLLALEEA
jgi:pimeloyl-ACP methyl ester carboxylesterase